MLHASVSPVYQEILYLLRNTPKLPIEKLVVLFQNIFSVIFYIPWLELPSSVVLGMF